MMLLALEASSDRRSVAIARDGRVLAETSHSGGRETPLAALVDQALGNAQARPDDLAAVAVGLGPGSYTGIRAALAFAQGWHLARPVRLLGLASSDACARRAWHQGLRGPVQVVIDAQRGEGYLAAYDLADDGPHPTHALRLATRADLESLGRDGARVIGPDLAGLGLPGTQVWPDAAALAELAEPAANLPDDVGPEPLEPIYLRPVAFVKAPPPRYPV